ncbi:MAG: hypothetical protein LBK71_07735, partial [Verrucomicrobiales bacterium]|nr:hypothetical protein [Verrucomicrobiales bacterium]
VVALIALFFLTAPLWQQRWIEPRPVADLSPSAPPLAESEVKPGDAYALLRQAAERYQKNSAALNWEQNRSLLAEKIQLKKNQQPFTREQFPRTAAWLDLNAAALDLMRRAAVAPNQRIPTVSAPWSDMTVLNATLRLGELLEHSAAVRAADGDWRGALDDLNAGLTVSTMLTRGGLLIHARVEQYVAALMLTRLHYLTVSGAAPVNLLKQELAWLRQHETDLTPFTEILRADYAFSDTLIDQCWKARALYPLYQMEPQIELPVNHWRVIYKSLKFITANRLMFDVGQLLGSTKPAMRANLNAFKQTTLKYFAPPYHRETLAHWQRELPPLKWHFDWFPLTYRDPLGYMLCHVNLMSGTSGVYLRRFDQQRLLRSVQISLAISAYRQEHGQPPLTLAALTPDYLPAVPRDPFDESQPLRYQRTADGDWLIYSIGPDQKDDAARPTERNRCTVDADGDLILFSAQKSR